MSDPAPADSSTPRGPLGELALLFLKLGCIAFGGPAAHIAMLEDEVVERRKWLTRQHFLDLVGATNLIPGPNSTEMTMHVGYGRAGPAGLFVAGACFIVPAVLLTGVLGWLYTMYGTLPEVEPFLYGIKPAVLAIILGALWKLGKKAVTGWRLAVLSVAVAAAVLGGLGEVWALLAGGLVGGLWQMLSGQKSDTAERMLPILFLQPGGGMAASAGAATAVASGAAVAVSLPKLFWFFLKVGSVLYGSGYVLVAFLEGGLVDDYGWMTQGQLLDAIAIGQFTPGPVLSTATFIGVLVGSAVDAPIAGGLLATLGIFLPSFLFVWILNPLIPRLRKSARLSALLDAVNASAVALMAAVTIGLGLDTLVSWPAWGIALLSAVAVLRFKVSAVWLVVGGALMGWALSPWA
ncbi:MAG: chromate efflux transporter [Bacteroidota bacterium]